MSVSARAGACAIVVGGLVFGVAWGKRMSPVTLILAGLVLGLYCGAVNSLLAFQQLLIPLSKQRFQLIQFVAVRVCRAV